MLILTALPPHATSSISETFGLLEQALVKLSATDGQYTQGFKDACALVAEMLLESYYEEQLGAPVATHLCQTLSRLEVKE